jgi:hypothetical protein
MRKAYLASAGLIAAAVAVGVVVLAGGEERAKTRAPREAREATRPGCIALWNRPENARQRRILGRAAVAARDVTATTSEDPELARRAVVLRYTGPPLEDVGVGEQGVNASGGECLVAHLSQVMFLYTRGAWRQVGYSPGLAFAGVPQRAARAPNALVTIRGQPGSLTRVQTSSR